MSGGPTAAAASAAAATTAIGGSGSVGGGGGGGAGGVNSGSSSVLARSAVVAGAIGIGPVPGAAVDLLAALELANTTRQGVKQINGPQQMIAYSLQGNYLD